MKLSVFAAMLVGVALFVTSCQTVPYAREVKKKPATNGMIALRLTHTDADRAKADQLMKANCGSKAIVIDEEGEVAVGQRTSSDASTSRGTTTNNAFSVGGVGFGNTRPSENTSGTSETTAVKEWQIAYTCGAKEVVEPAAPPAAAEQPAAAPATKAKAKKGKKAEKAEKTEKGEKKE